MRSEKLLKRLQVLEGQPNSLGTSGDRWPPQHCDPKRRLAKYRAWFENQPWECTGTWERKAASEAALIRYRKYFDDPEEDVSVLEWP